MKKLFVFLFFLPFTGFGQEKQDLTVEQAHLVFANFHNDLIKSQNDFLYADEYEPYGFYFLKTDTAIYGMLKYNDIGKCTMIADDLNGNIESYHASLQFDDDVSYYSFFIKNKELTFAYKKDFGAEMHMLMGDTKAFFFETAEYTDIK